MTTYVRFKYTLHGFVLGTYPATIPVSDRPRIEKGPNFLIPDRFVKWIYDNNGDREAKFLLGASSGWVNVPGHSESLTMQGNIARVAGRSGSFLRLDSLTANSSLPNPNDLLHVHQFTCITRTGQIRLPADGLVIRYPFLIGGAAWVHESKVDIFEDVVPAPIFPASDNPAPADPPNYVAIVTRGAPVRQTPGGAKVGTIGKGAQVNVYEEAKGYGKIADKRWVELVFLNRIGTGILFGRRLT